MIAPMNRIAFAAVALMTATWPGILHAQDVPGIEICTVEKTMERRTSCLQSNVDFLQKTITKLTTDNQQKLDAANRQIEALKAAVIGLQKLVVELQAAQGKATTTAPKDAAGSKGCGARERRRTGKGWREVASRDYDTR